MSYISPVTIFENMNDIVNSIIEEQENSIHMSIQTQLGIEVDKDELMRALAYDRGQYNRGYADGYARGLEEGKVTAMRQLAETILEKYDTTTEAADMRGDDD